MDKELTIRGNALENDIVPDNNDLVKCLQPKPVANVISDTCIDHFHHFFELS